MNKKKIVMYALFFGGLWGIVEATLGYLLNLSTLGLSGCIMFPIGFYILRKGYKHTNEISVIYYSTIIASIIKLFNLFMPISHPVKVINPAFAILLEGLSVAVLVSYTVKSNKKITALNALATSLSWRAIYLIDTFILFYINIPSRMIQKGPNEYLLNFIIINSIANALIILLIDKLEEKGLDFKIKPSFIKPATAICSFTLAITTQLFFTYIKLK